jgi:small subunit ribosomal protein S6
MAKTIANYELMYIIDPDIGEEETAAMVEKFKTLIGKSGVVGVHQEIGRKKLAYLINDKPDGYYVLVRFSSGPGFPAELDRVMKITDGVMRSMITVASEHGNVATDAEPVAEATAEPAAEPDEGTDAEPDAEPTSESDAEATAEPEEDAAAESEADTDEETKED